MELACPTDMELAEAIFGKGYARPTTSGFVPVQSAPIRLLLANILLCLSMTCSPTCAASPYPRNRRHLSLIPFRKKFRFRKMPHREAEIIVDSALRAAPGQASTAS